MPITAVSTVATSRSMVSRADVKTELGISGSGDDAQIDRMIVAASQVLASKLGRPPWLETVVERRPGNGGVFLQLERWPLKGEPASVTLGTGDSPTTVTAADYSVVDDERRDALYKATGWNLTARDRPKAMGVAGNRPLDYNVTYTAGWVMPDEITEWSSGAAVAASSWWKATDVDEPLIFQADATGGTHDSSEPTWPTVQAGTVTSNSVVYTAYNQRLPQPLEEAALVLVMDWYGGGLTIPADVKREAFEGMVTEYARDAGASATTRAVDALTMPYRSLAA